jgi:ATP dependent DNA ligase C terminal region
MERSKRSSVTLSRAGLAGTLGHWCLQYATKPPSAGSHVGTGFDQAALKSLYATMQPLRTDKKPFDQKVKDKNATTWLIPKLVGEVKFTEWTSEGEMRHPPSLGSAATKRRSTLSANNHENLKFAPVGRVAPEILRQPALETGPAKLYERLAMHVCCAADRVGRTDVRYPAATIEACDSIFSATATACESRLKRTSR